ncbi:MAG: type I CRISPR-associated protein Cas7 [Sulfurimonas sp.]|uniref:type I CRISPR-associated protein Cas7 n=1 Tax=Sulfurimonas sp. TaxID=2022749 RepID=UPI002601ED1E|nr:type I CRISPR-associated protein Cas7 [Sulfurimonas sp.]MDD5373783.1 type I CRISPR-associated protein Cas7 [Sulfurimonas sp.]
MNNSEMFENRVFGAVLVKAVTANYNADFTGSPRTLPNGVVYATDKALKYCIRNYLKQNNETIFYTTRHKKENMQPLDIDETYIELFGEYPKKEEIKKEKDEKKFLEKVNKKLDELKNDGYKEVLNINDNYLLKKEKEFYIIGQKPDDIKRIPILQNLLTAIDIKLFGATFASKEGNISIHGNVQITHGLNIYEENNIFSEDITSPFRNSSDSSDDSMQTTIGNQTVLEEGHYLHNFTINPKNTKELVGLIDNKGYLTNNDIENFKEAINKGVTYLDSASKAGVENEFSIFITLDKESKIQLPSLITLIKIKKQNGFKRKLDLSKIKELLNEEILKDKIAKVEIFLNEYALDYDDEIFDIQNVCVKSIVSDKELQKCQK